MKLRVLLFVVILGSSSALRAADTKADFDCLVEKATRYQLLRHDQDFRDALGLEHLLGEPGKLFVIVDLKIRPKWTETATRMAIATPEVMLLIPGATIPPMGYVQGNRLKGTYHMSKSKPRKWKEHTTIEELSIAYQIPKSATKAFISVQGKKVPVNLNTPVQRKPKAWNGAAFTIKKSELLDTLPSESKGSKGYYPTWRGNPLGKILALHVKITPTEPNDGASFRILDESLRLLMDNGYSIGPFFRDGRRRGVRQSLYIGRKTDGSWDKDDGDTVYYFAVPAELKSYKLLLVDELIAEGSVN